jgi:hypothetical protein
MLKVVRFVNLVLAGLLVGNEVGTKVAVHPALEGLSTPERIRAEQEVTRRYGEIMPLWMLSVIVSCLPVVALSRGTRLPAHCGGDGLLCGDARLDPDRQRADQQPRARALAGDGRRGVRGTARAVGQAAQFARRAERGRSGVSVRGSAAR